ncbi:MAG: hypothetical protein Q4F28_10755 [Eubacteriales bacterium]|nr:hypothetical protein [Eubacteriales bacterium]
MKKHRKPYETGIILLALGLSLLMSSCLGTRDTGESSKTRKMDTIQAQEIQREVCVNHGDDKISLYRLEVWNYSYDEGVKRFISGDGPRLHNVLSEIAGELPVVVWDDTCSVGIPEDMELVSVDVFGGDYQKIDSLDQVDDLQQLPSGTYYIGIEVKRQGDYIEAADEYEGSGLQYAFCMEKRAPVS